MKYMRWSDLEPDDVLKFSNDYIKSIVSKFGSGLISTFLNKRFIISKVNVEPNFVYITFIEDITDIISINGAHHCLLGKPKYDIAKVGKEQ